MGTCTTEPTTPPFSPCASLAARGSHLRHVDLCGPIRDQVLIAQKTVKHTPTDKLYDGCIAMLAGAHGIVAGNTRLRSAPGVQRACGRAACAEQSVIQAPLDAATATNVEQVQPALDVIDRRHSPGYRHDYARDWQLLDADMTGLPGGKKAAFATKGYCAKQRNRCGRQRGRVLATRYDDMVVEQLCAGTTQLATALQPLVQAAEQTLELDAAKRARTILRVDAGGGSVADVHWALQRGSHIHGKDYAGPRARTLAARVTRWVDDPQVPGRHVGWVTTAAVEYVRPVERIAVRCRTKNGQWGVGVLIASLTAPTVIALTGQAAPQRGATDAVLLADVYRYDQRGGGVETSIKADKHGLGLTKRTKQRVAAQQMVLRLGTLAPTVVVWARRWLAPQPPTLWRYGIARMVRDVFPSSGAMIHNAQGQVIQIVLNQAAPLVRGVADGLSVLRTPAHGAVRLGQT